MEGRKPLANKGAKTALAKIAFASYYSGDLSLARPTYVWPASSTQFSRCNLSSANWPRITSTNKLLTEGVGRSVGRAGRFSCSIRPPLPSSSSSVNFEREQLASGSVGQNEGIILRDRRWLSSFLPSFNGTKPAGRETEPGHARRLISGLDIR